MFDDLHKKINQSKIINDPFEHLVIDDFLPNNMCEELLQSAKNHELNRLAKPGTRYSPHRYFEHTSYSLNLRDVLSYKFNVEMVNTEEINFVHKDEPGYELWPHCDHMGKKISLIIYLDDFKWGTNLYKHNSGYMDTTGKRFSPEEFTIAKTIEAKKNRAFIFARTPNSWHGVSKIDEHRYLWLVTYQSKDWVSK